MYHSRQESRLRQSLKQRYYIDTRVRNDHQKRKSILSPQKWDCRDQGKQEYPVKGWFFGFVWKIFIRCIKLNIIFSGQVMGLAEFLNSLGRRYPNIAYVYAILGYVFLAMLQVAVKYVSKTISPFQMLFMRAFCLFLLNLYILRRAQQTPYIRNSFVFRQMLKRLMFSTSYVAITHYCVKYLPVSTVVSLGNVSPIFIFFVEAAYYKKPLNKINLIFAVVSFMGVLLVLQPEFLFAKPYAMEIQNFTWLSCLVLVSALCYAMTMLYIHDLSKKVTTIVNLHYSYIAHMMFTSILASFYAPVVDFEKIDVKFIFAFFMVVLLALLTQYMIFSSASLKEPSLTMPLGYIAIIVSFIADVALFGIQFNLTSIFGIFLTSVGLLSKLFIKSDQSKQKVNKNEVEQDEEQRAAKRKSSCEQQIQKI